MPICLICVDILSLIGLATFLYYLSIEKSIILDKWQLTLVLVAISWLLARFFYLAKKKNSLSFQNSGMGMKFLSLWLPAVTVLMFIILFSIAFVFLL